MNGHLLISGTLQGRTAAAYLAEGQLADLLIEPPHGIPAPGTLLRGRAGRAVKGLGGCFVDLPGGQRGFLRQSKGIAAGQTLWVQVTGFAVEGKAIPVTSALNIRGRYAVLTPDAPGRNISRSIQDDTARTALDALADGLDLPANCGMILRSSSETALHDDIRAELDALLAKAHALTGQADTIPGPDPAQTLFALWPQIDGIDSSPEAFDHHDIDTEVARILAPDIALPSGGSVTIEPTRALVAVDINTGPDTSPAAGLKATLEAARDLPRLLRLRGLGGQIVLDPAPFPKKDRRTVESHMTKAFRPDPISTTLAGWTPLGHFELQRRRERRPLEETLR